MAEENEMNDKEETEGKASKLADGIADGYEAVNSVMGKTTSNVIRATGKMIDETIKGTKDGMDQGKNPIDKTAKATAGGTKSIVKGGSKAVKEVAKGVGESIKAISDSVKKTSKALSKDKDED